VRDKIKLEDEAASLVYMDREIGGQKLKVGLLNLPSFYADNRKNGPSAATDMKKLLAEAVKNKADALVLDLSNNGGGSLRDAVDIGGLFFGTGNVVKQSQRSTPELDAMNYETLRDTDAMVDWPGPLVVLTSRVSASASKLSRARCRIINAPSSLAEIIPLVKAACSRWSICLPDWAPLRPRSECSSRRAGNRPSIAGERGHHLPVDLCD